MKTKLAAVPEYTLDEIAEQVEQLDHGARCITRLGAQKCDCSRGAVLATVEKAIDEFEFVPEPESDMGELIKELTAFLKEATLYLARQNNPEKTVAPAPQAEAPKATRTRAPKAEAIKEPTPETKAPAAEAKNEPWRTDEKLSYPKLVEVTVAFVKRFKDGKERGNAILQNEYKVAKLPDLSHAQRVELIDRFSKEIQASITAPEPAGIA